MIACAYCIYHNKEMKVEFLKKHGCLHKDNTGRPCRYLWKHCDHPYWKEREETNKLREERKKRLYG